MSNFDNSILIKNIKLQMKKRNETQKQVAEAIGMSQPNFNKAINEKGSKLFTIEQLYKISQHFGIGIDTLLGNKIAKGSSTASICSLIRRLIDTSIADVTETSYYDSKYFLTPDPFPYNVLSSTDNKNTYLALVFPNREFKDRYLSEDDAYNLRLTYARLGNEDHRNEQINTFIKKYIQIYHLYLKGDIEYNIVELAYKSYIEEVISAEESY